MTTRADKIQNVGYFLVIFAGPKFSVMFGPKTKFIYSTFHSREHLLNSLLVSETVSIANLQERYEKIISEKIIESTEGIDPVNTKESREHSIQLVPVQPLK